MLINDLLNQKIDSFDLLGNNYVVDFKIKKDSLSILARVKKEAFSEDVKKLTENNEYLSLCLNIEFSSFNEICFDSSFCFVNAKIIELKDIGRRILALRLSDDKNELKLNLSYRSFSWNYEM